jgi:transcription elongation factor GreA
VLAFDGVINTYLKIFNKREKAMKTSYPITMQGAKKLQAELYQLKSVERPKVIAAIVEARAHGDLKENAEYHAARERQGFLEGRIQNLQTKLAHAQVIDITKIKNDGRVIFGATVTLLKLDAEEENVTYQIVGEDESDIKAGKLAVNAPMARALIGKELYDAVEVDTPSGVIKYEIIEIQYI